VRHFIAIAEKELELYYRHIALYGDPNDRNPISILDSPRNDYKESEIFEKKTLDPTNDYFCTALSDTEADSTEVSESVDNFEDEDLSISESDSEDDSIFYSNDEEKEPGYSMLEESSNTIMGSAPMFENKYDSENQNLLREHTIDMKN
jgi:hypothetical protein